MVHVIHTFGCENGNIVHKLTRKHKLQECKRQYETSKQSQT